MKKYCFFFLLLNATVFGQISLNTSFGDNGFVYLPQTVTGQARVRVVAQTDNKILLSGSQMTALTNRADYIVRLTAGGAVDQDYASYGYYMFTDAIDDINAAQVFPTADGGLVCLTDDIGSALIKLQPNGAIDPGFTPNAGYANFATQDFAFADQDQHLYFIAPATLYSLQRIEMTTGLIDPGFGTVSLMSAAPIDTDAPALVTADGKFVVLSRFSTINGDYQCYLKRVLPDGQLDPGFGVAGKARLYGAPESAADDFSEMYESFATDEAGALYIASSNSNNITTIIYKLDAGGQPDPNFGTAGKVIMPPNHFVINTYWHENSLYVLGQKIISGLDGNMMIAKYDANGLPDANFGTNGIYTETSNPYYESGESLAFTPDGGIVVAGETREIPYRNAYVAKYLGENLSIAKSAKITLNYANPVTDVLAFPSDAKVISIHLYNIDGRSVRNGSGPNLAVGNLPMGLYMARVELADGSLHHIKILKQ